MADGDSGFKVDDRRKFTEDGQLRDSVEEAFAGGRQPFRRRPGPGEGCREHLAPGRRPGQPGF